MDCRFFRASCELHVVHRALAADILRPRPRGDKMSFADLLNIKPYRDRPVFKMHPDQSVSYVKAGVRFDVLHSNRLLKILITCNGK